MLPCNYGFKNQMKIFDTWSAANRAHIAEHSVSLILFYQLSSRLGFPQPNFSSFLLCQKLYCVYIESIILLVINIFHFHQRQYFEINLTRLLIVDTTYTKKFIILKSDHVYKKQVNTCNCFGWLYWFMLSNFTRTSQMSLFVIVCVTEPLHRLNRSSFKKVH